MHGTFIVMSAFCQKVDMNALAYAVIDYIVNPKNLDKRMNAFQL